jgi:uncharacterized cupredoxin-like copper-binding protein
MPPLWIGGSRSWSGWSAVTGLPLRVDVGEAVPVKTIRLLTFGVGLAALTTCSSGSDMPAVSGPTRPELGLDAKEMTYEPDRIAVAAGTVPVVLRNVGLVRHDLRVEGRPQLLLEADPGQTATTTWQLPKGRYEIYCSIPGHRPAGMEGILEVR